MDVREPFDLVAEHLDPHGELFVGRMNLDHVAADAKRPAAEGGVVAVVLQLDEFAQQLVAVDFVADADGDDAGLVLVRRSEAEDAGDAGDDHHVAA